MTYPTIGDLIRSYRNTSDLTLAQLENLTGINKGIISKIENGKVKRPDLEKLQKLSSALHIPEDVLLTYYIDVEQRPSVLQKLLQESVASEHLPTISQIALRIMQSTQLETYTALEYVYEVAGSIDNNSVRLCLYDTIIWYARDRGVQRYVAKALLQKYLIERYDFARLAETYTLGKELLHYMNRLSQEERIVAYYRLGLQAFSLKLYADCIELCRQGIEEDKSTSEGKAAALLALCRSCWEVGDTVALENYLLQYQSLPFDAVPCNARYIRAILYAQTGDHQTSLQMFRVCLAEADQDSRLYIVNEMLATCVRHDDWQTVRELIEAESSITMTTLHTPYKQEEMARFYKYKGDYHVEHGMFEEGIANYLTSIIFYKRDDSQDMNEFLHLIISHHLKHRKSMGLNLLEKLDEMYHTINKLTILKK